MRRFGGLQRLLAIVLLLFVAPTLQAEERTAAHRLITSPRVLVIGHRGDSRAAPENTLPAFASAVEVGCDLIELDYHHTADGRPVVLHDGHLDRTTNARSYFGAEKIPVSSKTLDELRPLDAGSWFSQEFAGVGMPTLEEALRTIQAGSVTLIERKAGDAKTCIDLLRKHDLLHEVVVQAFDWSYVAECHRLEPSIVLAALGGRELTDTKLDLIEETGAHIVAWHHGSIGAPEVERIHARGLQAWCFTVNSLDRVEELLDAGIDGIITDIPAQVKVLVDRHNSELNAAATGVQSD